MISSLKPLIIPIFIPHLGCPHQCSFCNQKIITNKEEKLPDSDQIRKTVDSFLRFKGRRKTVEIAFYGGSFLGIDKNQILKILKFSQSLIREKKINSIRFSTRPDTITKENIELIKEYSISAIELGAQSMNDKVLLLAKRGHTAQDTIKAVSILKTAKINIGIQFMVGLPGDNDKTCVETVNQIVSINPDFVRIYPLIILKKSLVEVWYKQRKYTPMSLEQCVFLVKKIVKVFNENNIPVVRIGLQPSDTLEQNLVAGPWHPAFGQLVLSEILYDKACSLIKKNFKNVILKVHPYSESIIRGNKNKNIEKLKLKYPYINFSIEKDFQLDVNNIIVEHQ